MSANHDELDVDDLRASLHGLEIGDEGSVWCDYCNHIIPLESAVCYEVIRLGDLSVLKSMLPTPTGWMPDAVRCANCEIEALEPATDGYDEVLVELIVTESNGILSIDATDLSILDHSPDGEGYYSPGINLDFITQHGDYGHGRWLRLKYLLETPELRGKLPLEYTAQLANAREIPPGIDL